jgi:hypothetical protein
MPLPDVWGELRRTPLLPSWVNKGKKEGWGPYRERVGTPV